LIRKEKEGNPLRGWVKDICGHNKKKKKKDFYTIDKVDKRQIYIYITISG
jgi:hypothetical protein